MSGRDKGFPTPFDVSAEALTDLVTTERTEQFKVLKKKFGGIEGLAGKLKTSLDDGLSRKEVTAPDARIKSFGNNHLPDPPYKSFFELLWEGAQDVTIIILSIAAVISLGFGLAFPPEGESGTAWIEGAAILVAVLLVLNVGAINNYAKEKQFKDLDKQKQSKPVEVIRAGDPREISSDDLLVGDIVLLKQGERVPADGLFIDGCGTPECRLDMSAMTGESVAVVINTKNPVMTSGAIMEDGLAKMVVIAVGEESQYGILFKNLQGEEEQTPLEEKLDTLAAWIGYGGMGAAIAIFVVLILFFLIEHYTGNETISRCIDIAIPGSYKTICWEYDEDLEWSTDAFSEVTQFAIIAITIVVVAVPEGLPLAVTISLAYSMKQMMNDQCLVRRLAACETMGGATTICSDKTGTLTENRMSVVKGWVFGNKFSSVQGLEVDPKFGELLFTNIALNSTANVAPPQEPGGLPEFTGPKTECALLVFGPQVFEGANYLKLRKEYKNKIVKMYPFTSDRKRMSVAVQSDDEESQYRLYSKGASELILERSAYMVDKNGDIKDINGKDREQLNALIEDLADQGLRTIGLAYRNFSDAKDFEEDEDEASDPPEYELTLLAIVGIMDPVRKEVPDAVKKCQDAGIIVRMVTGDNLKTAVKIAKDCGIFTEGGLALNGPEFRAMSDSEIDKVLPNLQVLARSIPTDKKRLVKRLKACREVVAVTGDGTNDAPALKAAHVGLAMGRSGTDVAKQASDIVILDDNFASIVMAVLWGRSVYDNIKKFLQFQLTVNCSAVAIAFVSALTDRGTPLTATQLLWVNLIMDTMAALALATEKPTPDLLDRKPYGLDEKVPISAIMWRNILGQAAYQIAVLMVFVFLGADFLDIEDKGTVHYTMVFNSFVWMQIFNEINARKVNNEWNVFHNIHTNWMFMAVMVITVILQIVLVEFGGDAFKTTHLSIEEWAICVGLGFVSLPLGFILRLIPIDLIVSCLPWGHKTEYVGIPDGDIESGRLLSSSSDDEDEFAHEKPSSLPGKTKTKGKGKEKSHHQ